MPTVRRDRRQVCEKGAVRLLFLSGMRRVTVWQMYKWHNDRSAGKSWKLYRRDSADRWLASRCTVVTVDCSSSKKGMIKTVSPDFRLILSINGLNMFIDAEIRMHAPDFPSNGRADAPAFLLDTFVTRLFNACIPCCTD